jgi:hypothetical protein
MYRNTIKSRYDQLNIGRKDKETRRKVRKSSTEGKKGRRTTFRIDDEKERWQIRGWVLCKRRKGDWKENGGTNFSG